MKYSERKILQCILPLRKGVAILQNSQENICARASFLIKLQTLLKKTLAQVFSCEFCKISKNNFFTEHVWATASKVYFILRVRGLPPTNQTLILLICLVSVLTLLLILFNSFQYLLQNNGKHQPFKRQHHKMIKHKQFVGSLPINCLSVLDHFVRFALKGLN